MKRLAASLAGMAVAALLVAGCTQAAPAPTPTRVPAAPTQAPAAPTKAPEATKPAAPIQAPTAAPTAAPAKKVDYPAKGRTVTMAVPFAAGGSADVGARILAPMLEKDLGVPVQVANKPGAGSQTALTELAMARPDGYSLLVVALPTGITVYLDPERKPAFGRKDLQMVSMHLIDPMNVAVLAESPYKTMKDLVDAAKASPEKVKFSTTGILGVNHLLILQLEKLTGAKFATVHFDGGAPAMTALLGGHVDAFSSTGSQPLPQVKAGKLRVIGIADKQESKFYPGVKTLEAQGYPISMASSHGIIAPAGTPKEITDLLSQAVKKAVASDEFKKAVDDMGLEPRYLDTAQYTAYWTELETQIKPLMEAGKQK